MQTAARLAIKIGRATVVAVGLGASLALLLGAATVALAAVPGDPLKLGRVNTINAASTLVGNVSGSMLTIDNSSTEADATALSLQVQPGKSPIKVNSRRKVIKLNSDMLDGKNSAAFFSGKTYDVRESKIGDGNGTFVGISSTCDDGDKALGGGGNATTDDDEMTDSFPLGSAVWASSFRDNGNPGNFTTFARCADFPPLR